MTFPAQRYRETRAEKQRKEAVGKVRDASRSLRVVTSEHETAMPIATRETIQRKLAEVQSRLAEIDEMLRGASEIEAVRISHEG